MLARSLTSLALAALLVSGAGCGSSVNLAESLEVVDVSGGFYNNGLKDGQHHLLPSVSFRVRNRGSDAVDAVQVLVQFRRVGFDEDFHSQTLPGIDLAAGGQTDATLIRSERGYTLADPNVDELFNHSSFVDFTARFFARRSGALVQIGEHTIERRILAQATAGRP